MPFSTATKASSKVGAGQRLHRRIHVAAGRVGIGARLALERDAVGLRSHVSLPSCFAKMAARALQVARRVDAQRHRVDDGRVDAHARLQRPQLLQFLAFFKRGRRQRDEARKRGAALGVDADMVIERPLAPGRGGAGEIERAQPARSATGEPTTLTTLGSVRSASSAISTASVAMSTSPSPSGASTARTSRGRDGGQVALQVDDGVEPAVRDRAPAAPRTPGRSPRHGRPASSPPRSRRGATASAISVLSVATTTRPSAALGRAAGDMHDHRLAGDVGQRLARQARGSHAGGNDDDGGHDRSRRLGKGRLSGKRSHVEWPLYVLQPPGKRPSFRRVFAGARAACTRRAGRGICMRFRRR